MGQADLGCPQPADGLGMAFEWLRLPLIRIGQTRQGTSPFERSPRGLIGLSESHAIGSRYC